MCESFAKISPPTRKDEIVYYKVMSISWLAPNIIVIEKNWSTDSFVSDDPRVYERVCYEMLVGKEYYAFELTLPHYRVR